MNALTNVLQQDKKLLSIYATAGYPNLDDTAEVLLTLDKTPVDFIEVGLPFSDPLADGATIQNSSTQALENGMNTGLLFEQLGKVKDQISTPLVLMGYFNPMLQFGMENFCKACAENGVSACIIPDLPVEVYKKEYQELFEQYGLSNIFLITPQSPEARIREIDALSTSFIYVVSSNSLTGAKSEFGESNLAYFKQIKSMGLKTPLITGFGISNHKTFLQATEHTQGAIVGSAFIKQIGSHGLLSIPDFVKQILEG